MTLDDPLPVPGEAGVRFVPPPPDIIGKVESDIQRAIDAVGKDMDIALVATADRKGGWNGALVVNGPKGFSAVTWFGKEWGSDKELDWGARVMWTAKFK
jgi:hypothetical protein